MSTPAALAELRDDLRRGDRDARYRAARFVADRGGPPLHDGGTELATLAAVAPAMLAWIDAQADPQALARAYGEFVERWSPVFRP